MLESVLPRPSKDTRRNISLEEIANFLFDMVKDEMSVLENPRFSFYRYLDQRLAPPRVAVLAGIEPLSLNAAPAGPESAQSPTSTPKFVSSEDNTQTKTNYYTEPSIGMLSPQPKRSRGCEALPNESFSEPFGVADKQDHTNFPASEDDHTFEVPLVNGSIFQECDKPSAPGVVPAADKLAEKPPAVPSKKSDPEPMKDLSLAQTSIPCSRSQSQAAIVQLPVQVGGGTAPKSPRLERVRPVGGDKLYYLDGVERRAEGVYIYLTTEAKKVATKKEPVLQPQEHKSKPAVAAATKVSISLPSPKELLAQREKSRRLAQRTLEVKGKIDEDKKYASYCTKVIKQLNNTTKAGIGEIHTVIVYAAKLIQKLSGEGMSRVLKAYQKVLTQTLCAYMSALSVTLMGKNNEIFRRIFARCALLMRISSLAEQSVDNIDFISGHLDSTADRPELQKRLKLERSRARAERKLAGMGKEIVETLRTAELQTGQKEFVEQWCRVQPVECDVADIVKLIDTVMKVPPVSTSKA